MSKIEIRPGKPKVTEQDEVTVDIHASLYLEENDPNGGMRIPNITFEVRSAISKVNGISADDGILRIKDVPISNARVSPIKKAPLTVTAYFSDQGVMRNIKDEVLVDISEQLEILNAKIKKEKARQAMVLAKKRKAKRAKKEKAERQRLREKQYQKLSPERKRQLKARITQAGEDIKRRVNLQFDPFNVLRENANHPHAERTALMVAEQVPDRTLNTVDIFVNAHWAHRVVRIATQKNPRLAIENIEKFKNKPWAKDILIMAAKRHPHYVVAALPNYCDAARWEPKDVMFYIAEYHPQALFEKAEMWEFYPWAEEVATIAAEKAPHFMKHNFHLYQDQPWAQRLFNRSRPTSIPGTSSTALVPASIGSHPPAKPGIIDGVKRKFRSLTQRLLDDDRVDSARRKIHSLLTPDTSEESAGTSEGINNERTPQGPNVKATSMDASLLSPAEKLRRQKNKILMAGSRITNNSASPEDFAIVLEHQRKQFVEQLMVQAAEQAPKLCIQHIRIYKTAVWSCKVMEIAAQKSPSDIFAFVEDFEEMGWAERIIKAAAMKDPGAALAALPRFDRFRFAKRVVMYIAKHFPEVIFKHIKNIEFQPWAEAVIRLSAANNPSNALELLDGSYAQPKVTAIVQNVILEQERREQRKREREEQERRESERRLAEQREQKRKEDQQRRQEEEKKAAEREHLLYIFYRNLLLKLGGIGLSIFALGGHHCDQWLRSPDYKHQLKMRDVFMLDIRTSSDKEILPRHIQTILTKENLETLFKDFDAEDYFAGNHKKFLGPETLKTLSKWVEDQMGYTNKTTLVAADAEENSERILTMYLTPRDKNYPDKISEWLRVTVEGIDEAPNTFNISIEIDSIDVRPISERIDFKLKDGQVSDIFHTTTIKAGYFTTYRDYEVVHDEDN